jgi:hypothetical protein
MKRAAIFVATVVMLVGCDKEAKHDSEVLDAKLAAAHIDRVEFVSWNREITNTVSGSVAKKILASLAATNRTSGRELKDGQRHVYFMNRTQKVLDLVLDDNGLWHFGEYRFALCTQ